MIEVALSGTFFSEISPLECWGG